METAIVHVTQHGRSLVVRAYDPFTFVEWLGRRMRRDIELNGDSDSAIVHCTQHGGRLVVSAYEQINSVGSHRAAT